MSSGTKEQTADGFITEYSNKHHIAPMDAVQTVVVKDFLEYADERDTAKLMKEREQK